MPTNQGRINLDFSKFIEQTCPGKHDAPFPLISSHFNGICPAYAFDN